MSKLQHFVNDKSRQVPQTSQGLNQGQLRSHQNVAIPKVAVPSINRSNISQARNIASLQPAMNRARGKAPAGRPPRDTFAASEYEDSTISTVSRVQVKDSQVDDQGRPFASYDERYHPHGPPGLEYVPPGDDGEESGSGDEYEEDEETDDGAEEQHPDQQQHNHYQQGQVAVNQQGQAVVNQHLLNRSPFDGGDSYPPTTTGVPEDEEEDGESSQAEEPEQPAHQRPSYYQQSSRPLEAAVQSSISRHQQPAPDEQTSRPSLGRPQRRSLAHPNFSLRQNPQNAKPVVQQNAHLNLIAELQTSRPNSAPPPLHVGPKTSAKTRPISTGSAMANPTGRVPPAVPDVLQEPEVSIEEGGYLDYDKETLKEMRYEELFAQDYDVDPSHPASVLSADAPQDLPGRLGLVQKMSTENQRIFFSSLPLTEWEEVGDWFLSQFSEVVKKMTEARKEKRQLAIEFEAEIAKRHEYVASRKRGIDEALSEMGQSGRQVLRGSTPKRQKGRGSAN
jgi:hypothetical protein